MRHRVAGWKLGRNTSHRRALLRNLVTSLILEERIETTVTKAKALRPHVEKMITLGKKGDVASRRLAAGYLMTRESVDKLFDTIAPRFGDREGGYTRIVLTGFRKGDGGEKAFIELIGSEKVIDEACRRNAQGDGRAAATGRGRSFRGREEVVSLVVIPAKRGIAILAEFAKFVFVTHPLAGAFSFALLLDFFRHECS
jgi:large subunit ribosomal protein L17